MKDFKSNIFPLILIHHASIEGKIRISSEAGITR